MTGVTGVIGVVLVYFFKLSALQLTVQMLALVGTYLQQGSNQFIDGLSYLLGLTGDNSPKRKYIADTRWMTYSLNLMAALWTFSEQLQESPPSGADNDPTAPPPTDPLRIATLLLCFAIPLVFKFTSIFYLIKIYDGGYGLGFNFYYKGWRIVGLDWHKFLVCQDPKTGKPLTPEKQYWINRPHIDLPTYNLHHWPWAQTESHDEQAKKKAAAQEMRKEKELRKAAKLARREEKLRLRNPKGGDSPASSPGSPATPDVMHPARAHDTIVEDSPAAAADGDEDLSGLF